MSEPRADRSAGEPWPASPIRAVAVPPWQEGADASVLPRLRRDLPEVTADAGRPLRAVQIAGCGWAADVEEVGGGPAFGG